MTAEIKGDDEEKRLVLKKGALIAVAVVSSLYILLNFVMVSLQKMVPPVMGHICQCSSKLIWPQFWVLSLEEIIEQQRFTIMHDLVLNVGSTYGIVV